MRPTVRSRLWAAGTAFVVGFGVANVGILLVAGRDRWVWLAVAVVLMLTGAFGVVVADTRRRLSLWAVLGLELAVVATVLPLLWALTLATAPPDAAGDPVAPTSLLPSDPQWSQLGDALGTDALRHAAVTSAVSATLATVVAMLVAVPAAYVLVRRRPRGSRLVLGLVVALLLAPLVALASPWAQVVTDLDLLGRRWSVAPLLLLVAVPLATWLSVVVLRAAPWSLRDVIRADGASRRQVLRAFAVPVLLPDLVVVALLVWVVTAQDVVLGAALGATEEARTLPASLLLAGGASQPTAAVGLLCLLPVLLVVALAPRRVRRLVGAPGLARPRPAGRDLR